MIVFGFFLWSLAALKNMTGTSVCNSADNIAQEKFRACDAGKHFVESPLKQKHPINCNPVRFFFFFPSFFTSERKNSWLQWLVYENKLEGFWWKHLSCTKHLHLIEIIVFKKSGPLCWLLPCLTNTFMCAHTHTHTRSHSAHILMETPGWGPSTSSSSSCGSLSTGGSCSTLGMLGAGSLSPWRQATARQTYPHLVLLFSSWGCLCVCVCVCASMYMCLRAKRERCSVFVAACGWQLDTSYKQLLVHFGLRLVSLSHLCKSQWQITSRSVVFHDLLNKVTDDFFFFLFAWWWHHTSSLSRTQQTHPALQPAVINS